MKLTYAGLTTDFEATGATNYGYKLRYTFTVYDSKDNILFEDNTLESPMGEGLEVFCTIWGFLLYFIDSDNKELVEEDPELAQEIKVLKDYNKSNNFSYQYESLIDYLEYMPVVEEHYNCIKYYLTEYLELEHTTLDLDKNIHLARFIDNNLNYEEQFQTILNQL